METYMILPSGDNHADLIGVYLVVFFMHLYTLVTLTKLKACWIY